RVEREAISDRGRPDGATQLGETSRSLLDGDRLAAILSQLLLSDDPQHRQTAILLGQAFGLPSIRNVAVVSAETERDGDVRRVARQVLLENSTGASSAVERIVHQRTLRLALASNGLYQKLIDAQGYVLGGAPNGSREAIGIYHDVLRELTTHAPDA